jgi:hypothetical protein
MARGILRPLGAGVAFGFVIAGRAVKSPAWLRFGLFLAGISAPLLSGAAARADVSSWMYTGAGPGFLDTGSDKRHSVLELATGLGTPPAAVVFGGLFRTQTFFERGTDLALLARFATRGYVQGGFGLALDAGGYQRFWGVGSSGGTAALGFGAPWGVTLSASGGLGSNDQRFFVATLGLDFARLTVYRTHGTNWFLNPFATDERGRGAR